MAITEIHHTFARELVNAPLPAPGSRASRHRRRVLSAVVLPLLTFFVVTIAGGAYLLARPPVWQSGVSLAILPRPGADPADQASYYDTLSRGQIVSTAAKVVDEAVGRSGTPSVVVLVVPETSVITLTIKAGDVDTASSVAVTSLTRAVGAINALKLPYEATVIDDGKDAPSKATPSIVKSAAVVVVIALALAAAVQQAQAAIRRRRGR
jgi:hypothetical protein